MVIARPVTKTKISTVGWGIPITDEVNRLSPLVDANTIASIPTVWTNMSYVNGWVNYPGYQVGQYRRIGDIVYLRGMLQTPGTASGITTLPAGFRPPGTVEMACFYYDGASAQRRAAAMIAGNNGSLTMADAPGAGAALSINQCYFSTLA